MHVDDTMELEETLVSQLANHQEELRKGEIMEWRIADLFMAWELVTWEGRLEPHGCQPGGWGR